MTKFNALFLLRFALVTCVPFCVALGCASPKPVASTADLKRLGTRDYPDRKPEEVTQGVVTALKVLGYEVVTTQPRIRTAPKAVATSAYGYGGTAQAFTESVAWDIDVESRGSGTVLHAQARASVNGEPMEQVYLSWAERSFGELMTEIDASLGTR